jgi:hypothetical protein
MVIAVFLEGILSTSYKARRETKVPDKLVTC